MQPSRRALLRPLGLTLAGLALSAATGCRIGDGVHRPAIVREPEPTPEKKPNREKRSIETQVVKEPEPEEAATLALF